MKLNVYNSSGCPFWRIACLESEDPVVFSSIALGLNQQLSNRHKGLSTKGNIPGMKG